MSDMQQVPRRDEVALEHTWDLTTIYGDDAAWEADVGQLEELTGSVAALAGKVAQSGDTLLHTLQMRDTLYTQLYQIYVYAERRKDSDQTEPAGQALSERAGSIIARASAAVAFVDPEILAADEADVRQWLAETPGLGLYAYALDQLLRMRKHVRSAEVEALLADFGDVTRAPSEIFEALTNADLDYPTIDDEHGNPVKLSHARYGRYLESSDRRVRRDTFTEYYRSFQGIRNTLGTTLAAQMRAHTLNARVRGYASSLDAALMANDIPTSVYHNLVSTVGANLPKLHRYMAIRKQLMQLDDLRIYDLYTPLTNGVDVAVPYPEAQALMLSALQPLGETYGKTLRTTFASRWIDVYENVGKRSGAYSDGSYTTAPFILLNYQDRLDDAFTLAHELGHSMHSYFTRQAQPFVYGNYTIFVAEVASTLNEALLVDHLLKTREDPALREHLIVQQLEDIRRTLFRQTMFAEFELDMHRRSEAGEPLTAESLSKPYYDLVARYHGPAVTLDDEIALEWARIPHFYYNFYVYQYATGISAALALCNAILAEGQPAIDRYLGFLQGGSSQPSLDLLRGAGVDMASPAPVQAAMDRFATLLDELVALRGI